MQTFIWFFAAIMWMPVAFAGALGFVPLVGIVGLTNIVHVVRINVRPYMIALMAALVFAAWSSTWSPYTMPLVEIDPAEGEFNIKSAVLRVGIVAFFGSLCITAAMKMSVEGAQKIIKLFYGALWLQAIVLIGVFYTMDLVFEVFRDFTTDRRSALLNLFRNLAVFSVGAVFLLGQIRFANWPFWLRSLATGLFLALAIVYCVLYEATASAIVILVAWLVMFLPTLLGKYTFKVLGVLSALFLLFSPVIFGGLIYVSGDTFSESFGTLHWRLLNWEQVLSYISEKPISGWGLDALRTFDAAFEDGPWAGQPIIQIHSHNMMLHIWVETGAIGAGLTAIALVALGFRLPDPDKLSKQAAALTCGLWCACGIIASGSFSLWNDWWWAMVALNISFVIIVNRAGARKVALNE